MKILAAGDIHGNVRTAEKLAEKAEKEKADLVVLCGDIIESEGESTDNLIGPFVKKGKKVVLIPGNHESLATADFLSEMYDATNLHGYSIKVGNIGLFGCGLSNMGIFGIKEGEIFDTLKKGFSKIKDSKRKIMITHMHPEGSKSEFSGFKGSKSIRKAIEQFKPDLALFSHIHEAEGIEEKLGRTKLINVGIEGKIIEI